MAIRIPSSAFPQSTIMATNPQPQTHRGVGAMHHLRNAIKSLSYAMNAHTSDAEASQALTKARSALLSGAGALELEPEFADALDVTELLRKEARARNARETAISSLVAAIKASGALPLTFEQKTALGRALVTRAVRSGVLDADQQQDWAKASTSNALYEDTRRKLAMTSAPGEALAILADAKASGVLVEHDSATLDALADARQPVETHRQRARLAWKEQDDLAAFARGELPGPLGEESFVVLHGAQGAKSALAHYQTAREEGQALALIRGKSVNEIEQAQADWTGDPAIFQSALAKDSAARRQDPVGYVLATVPGLAQAHAEAPETERNALLWTAQAKLGLRPGEISPWTAAQEREMADIWDALPAGQAGRNEKLGFFEKYVMSLPKEQRSAAIERLIRQGIVGGTSAELTQIVEQLEAKRVNPARKLIDQLAPPAEELENEELSSFSAASSDLLPEKDNANTGLKEAAYLAAARDRVATIEAVGRIDSADDLMDILPRIARDYSDQPQTAAALETKARELAINPPPPASRDTEGRVRNFNEWAGDLGYYRDRHLIAATDAIQEAGYDVLVEADGRVGVIAKDEDEVFTFLSAEEVARLSLSTPEDLERFRLLLDLTSSTASLGELLARAEMIDPTTMRTGFNPQRGHYEYVRPSETAELIRLASAALANGADPEAVAAALKAGLFPTSDWLVAGELLFSLTPFGMAIDAVSAARAIQTLRDSDDEAERESAWGDLVVAMVGVAPIGDALKLGVRNIGTTKTWLRRLVDQRLTDDQLIERSTHFAEIGLRKKRVSFQIERLIGEAWTRLDERVQASVKGRAARLYGGLAERLVRPAAQAKLRRDGYRVFDEATELNYEGIRFNIDVVGIRDGADPIARTGEDTIEIAGLRYLLKDVRLIDAKFASASFTQYQRNALRALDKRGSVQRYVPLLEDMPVDDLADILNEIEDFRAAGIAITADMIMRHAESFSKGTTMADFLLPLIAAGLAAARPGEKDATRLEERLSSAGRPR